MPLTLPLLIPIVAFVVLLLLHVPPLMASVTRAGTSLQNDIRKGPIYLVDDQGRIVGLRIIR